MPKPAISLIPQSGEHALIVGQNGSGKTAFACWLLARVEQAPIIVYDTKIEPKFNKFPGVVIVRTMEEALQHKDDVSVDYIVVRPPVEYMREPKLLDNMLWEHYSHFQHCPAYIDEAYTFHSNARPGPGLIALLTRGRSRGISTIISTQRPVMLSRFCITEAKKTYVFRLVDKADRRRLNDVIPDYADMPQPVKHGFYFFESGVMEEPVLFKPITLDKQFETGYTDNSSEGEGDGDGNNADPDTSTQAHLKHVWV